MFVRDVMTSPAVTIKPSDEVAEAARVLDRLSITMLPVVKDGGELVGIITEADVIGRLATFDQSGSASQSETAVPRVRDIMTHPVLTVTADDELSQVVSFMSGTTLKSVPVLLHGRVAGVISRRDVVRALARGDLDARPTADTSST